MRVARTASKKKPASNTAPAARSLLLPMASLSSGWSLSRAISSAEFCSSVMSIKK